jgi:apolipoprotein D and lipocalin family protein
MNLRRAGGLLCLLVGLAGGQAHALQEGELRLSPGQLVGTWYEIARLPEYLGRHCTGNHAEVTVNARGGLEAVAICHEGSLQGPLKHYPLHCELRHGPGSTLMACRLLIFHRDLPVLMTTDDLSLAALGTPDHKHLMIVSRTAHVDEKALQPLLERARQQGFDLSRLIRIPQ